MFTRLPSPGLSQRPALATYVMGTIEAWSSAESHLVGITALLLRADPEVAMAMLLAVESQAAQRAIVLAAATAALAEKDLRLFKAVVYSASASRDTRNAFAHRLWGTSPQLPDALLLLDPKYRNTSLAAFTKWWQAARSLRLDTGPQPDIISRSKVYVWREADLQEAHTAALRTVNEFSLLAAMLAVDASGSLAASIRRQLSASPLVQDRLRHQTQKGFQPERATAPRATQQSKLFASPLQKKGSKMKPLP